MNQQRLARVKSRCFATSGRSAAGPASSIDGLALGQVDGDGRPDLIVVSRVLDAAVVHYNRPPDGAMGDGVFNQADIVQVLHVGKYLTGQSAGWSEDDWTGDGVFDQADIVAAMQTGAYLAG
jgi:hypothetical protein